MTDQWTGAGIFESYASFVKTIEGDAQSETERVLDITFGAIDVVASTVALVVDPIGTLLAAGIDCIEHGTGLTEAHIEQMVAGGVALVPTVLQTDKFTGFAEAGRDKFPAYAATMERLHARRREVLMAAHDAGVALYVGSDGGGSARHGVFHEEILAMAQMGLSNEYVLGAASWRARAWLGWNPGLDEGDPADFVVYPRNPVEDLSVLREPSAVVLRGRIWS